MPTSRRTGSADAPAALPTATGGAWTFTELITRLRRVLRASIRSEYPWESLPMAQVEIMQRLAEEPGLRVRELAERHRLAANTVSNLIQQLVVAGLVTRAVDAEDRRAVTVRLTEAGEVKLRSWLLAHETQLNAALTALSKADQRAIAVATPALGRLLDRLELIEADDGASGRRSPRPNEGR